MKIGANLDETLAIIAKRAPELRAAGVTRVELEGVVVELAPPEPVVQFEPSEAREFELDPLDDPDTYGGVVPTMRGHT